MAYFIRKDQKYMIIVKDIYKLLKDECSYKNRILMYFKIYHSCVLFRYVYVFFSIFSISKWKSIPNRVKKLLNK